MTEEKTKAQESSPPTIMDIKPSLRRVPTKMIIYGRNGIGKSSFAACAPTPIFIDLDKNTNELLCIRHDDINDFQINEYTDLIEFIDLLLKENHSFRTLVIDSVTPIQNLIDGQICSEGGGKKSIADFPHGAGYARIFPLWDLLLKRLEALWTYKKMHIILIGHAFIGEKTNPAGADYLSYHLNVDKRVVLPLQSWSTCMLFFADHTNIEEGSSKKLGKDVSKVVFDHRVIYTDKGTFFTAKNTIQLPKVINFDSPQAAWDVFSECSKNFYEKNKGDK